MKSTWKRWISVFLAVLLMVQLFPTAAFATNDDDIVVVGDWEEENNDDILDEEIPLVETEEEGDEIKLVGEEGEELSGGEKKTYHAEDVLWENRELRDAGTKHFHLSDGTDVAVLYEQQVHYMDDAGVYQDIDNTLELVDRDEEHSVQRLPDESSALTPGEESSEASQAIEEDAIIIDVEEADNKPEESIVEDESGAEEMVEVFPAIEIDVDENSNTENYEEADGEAFPEDNAEEGTDEQSATEDPISEDQKEKAGQTEESSEVEKDLELIEGETPDKGEEPKEKAGKEYRNRAGLIDIRLAELSNAGDLISLSDGKNTLRFTPAWEIEERPAVLLEPELPYDSDSFEAAVTPRNLTAGLRYDEVLPGVDLEYWVHPSGVKENIVLREPMGEASFPFILDCGELTPYRNDDGSITLCNFDGECVMRIPTGYMIDAQGALSEGITYELEDWGEGKYLLTIRADEAWLDEEDRAYPVNIDPAVTVAAYNHNNGLSSNYARSNLTSPEGTNRVLYCGYDYNTNYNQTLEYRVMLGFDQLPNLPANCMVVSSVLSIEQPTTGYSGSGKNYYIHQVNMQKPSGCSTYASWINNNLIWSHTTGSNISTEVMDYISASHSTAGVTFNYDVTRAVKRWYSESEVPHAFCIRRSEITSGYAWLAIQGYESTYRIGPALSVYYRNTVGLEDYYSYQSHSIDRAGTGYIGDYTGQLTLAVTDVAAASTVCPVTISHIYNSAYCAGQIGATAPGASGYSNMNVGQGWKLNIQQSVAVDDSNYLKYMDADGTIHYFYKTATNTYKDEDGLNLTITASGTNYTMTDRYGNISYFSGGLLSYSQDANGNRITYNRDSSNRVTTVTRTLNGSSAETIATLTYNNYNYLLSITDSAGNTTSFAYGGVKVTQITHADGTTVNYTYDSSGRMLTAKDNESSYSMTYTYDSQGRISKYTEKAGSTTGASVNASGAAGVRTYRYCGKDRILNNSDDLIGGYVFDNWGRTITSYTSDFNNAVIYSAFGGKYKPNTGTYGANNRLDFGGSVGIRPVGTSGIYYSHLNLITDANSLLLSTTGTTLSGNPAENKSITKTLTASTSNNTPDPSAKQTYLFSGWAKAASVPLNEGSDRSFELRAVIRYTDNTTETQAVSYCADSTAWQYAVLPIVPKYPNKTVSTLTVGFHYDHNANLAQFKLGCLTAESVSQYEWTDNGDLQAVSSPSNTTQTYTYSGADLIQQVTKGNGTFNYTYDSHHNVTGVTNAGLSMALSYDTKGNATSSTLTGGSLHMGSSATYTNNGNLIATQTDTRGKTTSYTYGNNISKQIGQPTAVTDPKSVTVNTSYNTQNGRVTGSSMTGISLGYTYGSGRLTAMTRTVGSAGQTYNMGYNGFGQLTSVKVGTRSLASYTYNSNNGVLNKLTYGNGNTVGYAYDNLERVTNIYYNNSSSPAYTYTYWGEGSLRSLTDNTNNRSYVYEYDGLNRLNKLTEYYGSATVQTFTNPSYDGANRLTSYQYTVSPSWNGTSTGTRAYGYTYNSNDGSLTSMTGPGASMAYTYDALKRLTKRVESSGSSEIITRNYSYLAGSGSNTSTLVSGLTAKHGSTTLFSGSYSYDPVGNISSITGSAAANYSYDNQNQLLTEVRGGTPYFYTYDNAGNIKTKTKISGSGTDTFTYGNTEWRDLLTAYNGNSITYDTVGNPTTWYDGATMTWVNGKRLASISATSGHSALAFTYDADGLRLTKTVGSVQHKYIWQGGKLVSENYGSTTLEFFYDESGAPYALIYNGTTYYYVTNLQGDVVKIVNASGTSQAEYSYNAWGQVISATGTLAAVNPIRYRGYYYDVESGFYYLKSRYYDPAICRFINADGLASTGQGFLGCNMFAYCNNNPVNGCDPSGELAITTLILIGSAVFGLGTALYSGYKMREAGESWGDTIFYSAGAGLCAFCTVYTLGMSAYELYCNMCWYYGNTPATDIGSPQVQLEKAAASANTSVEGTGHVAGTKKHTVFSANVNALNNSRIATEVSYKDGEIVPYGTKGSIRFDVVQYDKTGTPIRAWDFKTGSATLTQGRINQMQSRSGLYIPIDEIR